jgi:hypothetical protein
MCSNELKSEEEGEEEEEEPIKTEPVKTEPTPEISTTAKENCAILRKTLQSVKESCPVSDEALATCGRQVVDHVIDKLYSFEKVQVTSQLKQENKEEDVKIPALQLGSKSPKSKGSTFDCFDSVIRKAVSETVSKSVKTEKKNPDIELASTPVLGPKQVTVKESVLSVASCGKKPSTETSNSVSIDVAEPSTCTTDNSVPSGSSLPAAMDTGTGPKDAPDGKHEDDVFALGEASSQELSSSQDSGCQLSQEDDVDSAIYDDTEGLRKSKRTNRGRRYLELISEGYIQPPKGEKTAMKKVVHQQPCIR